MDQRGPATTRMFSRATAVRSGQKNRLRRLLSGILQLVSSSAPHAQGEDLGQIVACAWSRRVI